MYPLQSSSTPLFACYAASIVSPHTLQGRKSMILDPGVSSNVDPLSLELGAGYQLRKRDKEEDMRRILE